MGPMERRNRVWRSWTEVKLDLYEIPSIQQAYFVYNDMKLCYLCSLGVRTSYQALGSQKDMEDVPRP